MKRKAAISPTRTKDTGQRGLFPWMQSLFETLTLTPVLTSVDLAAQCLAQASLRGEAGVCLKRAGHVTVMQAFLLVVAGGCTALSNLV